MGIPHQELLDKIILFQANTEGGGTYYVEGRPTCLASLRGEEGKDQHCSLVAGWGTMHTGTGRCKYHGGRFDPRLTGRYSSHLRKRLRIQYEDFITDPDMLDLTPELATQRTLLRDMLEMYETGMHSGIIDARTLKQALTTLEDIGKMVERIERIKSQHVVTAATARLLVAKGLEVGRRFLEDRPELLPKFVETWHKEVYGLLVSEKLEDFDAPTVDLLPDASGSQFS